MLFQNRNEKGFTLIELMLSMLILTIVMLIVFTGLTEYNKRSKAQKNIILMDENVKSILYILNNYIQMTGFGCYYSLNYENKKINNSYDRVFTPNDNGFNGSDGLTVVLANRFIGYIVDDNASDSSNCYSGKTIYIGVDSSSKINLIDSNLKKYLFIDRCAYNKFYEISETPSSASLSNCPSGYSCYSIVLNNDANVCDNDSVYGVRAVSINYDSNDEEIELNENVGGGSYSLLSNVETIQFQYGIDRNDDGTFDDIDNDGNPLDNTVSKNDEKYLKLVKVSILLRTKEPDPDYRDNQTTYHIANQTIQLDTNDSNGINSKYDWHYRRKLIELNIVPRNIIYGY